MHEPENRPQEEGAVMSNGANIADTQQLLNRLARRGSEQRREVSTVTSPGAKTAAWAVKVKSLSSYNVYNVCVVVVGDAGTLPVEIGDQMQATNLAESFMQQGQLSAGTYAVMSRVGDRNVFYAPV